MIDDDLSPKKTPTKPKNLEPMSVEELSHYVHSLGEEIERAEAEIAKKKAYAQTAASFFKK